MSSSTPHTIKETLTRGEQTMASHNADMNEALVLLSHATARSITDILAHPDSVVTDEQYERFTHDIEQRMAGHSIAAIRGEKDFHGLTFRVDEFTLIPRPDSELLVDAALTYLESHARASVLDVGTGSGALIMSIALARCNGKDTYIATDISPEALEIAQDNARRYGISVTFIHSDLLNDVAIRLFDVIVANLPYLPTEALQEPSLKQEPIGALWGGVDGTNIIKRLIDTVKPYRTKHGLILLEVDPRNADHLAHYAQTVLAGTVSILTDLAGHARCVRIER